MAIQPPNYPGPVDPTQIQTGGDWWSQNAPPSGIGSQTPPAGGRQDDFGGPQNGDYQGWFNKLVAGKPYNQQTILDLEPILNKYGVQLTPPNAAGERTKINIPGQGWTRVGFGEGKPVWIPQGAGGGSGGGGGGFAISDPQYGTGTTAPKPFVAPTDVTMQNDPGFQFRMKEGQRAIENAAAAKGSLLSGGTLKALERYGQDYGSGEYGNVYNRAIGGYLANVGVQRGAQQDYWSRLLDKYRGGQAASSGVYQPPPG